MNLILQSFIFAKETINVASQGYFVFITLFDICIWAAIILSTFQDCMMY